MLGQTDQIIAAENGSAELPDRERIEAELARIEASLEFGRAPVMRRLLRFLIETTLSGRGGQLKAYSVAVDGLGRSPDFDAQSDSYPRVQVGRLRRMLQAFYSQHGLADGFRISIPAGAYVVEFTGDPVATATAGTEEAPAPAHWRTRLRPWALGGLLGMVIALALAGLLAWRLLAPSGEEAQRPADNLAQAPTMTVEIRAMQNARAGLAQAADAFLVDALRRSRLVRLRQPDIEGEEERRATADYRLTGAISGGPQPDLFVRLWRTDLDRLIWSGVVRLPADGSGLQQSLMPMLVELGQPFGVIASDQRARHAHDFAPGYACYLQFDLYRRDPDQASRDEVGRCIEATLRTDPRQAVALAAQALLLLDEAQTFSAEGPDRDKVSRAGLLARRAIVLDPYSPDAHFAASRAALLQGSCTRARDSGRRALNLDPYNPDMMARIGRDLAYCGDARGEKLVERAIALDPNPPASYFTPLVLAALGRGDVAGAKEIAERITPPAQATSGYYAFTMALVEAASGETDAARASWAAAAGAAGAGDPKLALKRWQLAAPEEELALSLLTKAGALAPPAGGSADQAATENQAAPATR